MRSILLSMLSGALLLSACNAGGGNEAGDSTNAAADTSNNISGGLREETVTFTTDSGNHQGFIVYDGARSGKRPVVLVVHEWWGMNEYVKGRARQLAGLGYLAMAVDMYGNGRQADNPEAAKQMAGPFYQNPQLTKLRIDAALGQLQAHPQADVSRAAAIGYCFGGFVVLNAANLGADLDGVVSFHGNLGGVQPDKSRLQAEVLVAHGANDSFVPQAEINAFRKGMDSIGARYRFIAYPGATHAFTNPNATETGKRFNIPIEYNAQADSASWNDMKSFLARVLQMNNNSQQTVQEPATNGQF